MKDSYPKTSLKYVEREVEENTEPADRLGLTGVRNPICGQLRLLTQSLPYRTS